MNSPHKGQWRRALMFFYLCLNKRLSKQSSNVQAYLSYWWLTCLLCNCPQINVTGSHQWSVNFGSGNVLVTSGTKAITLTNADPDLCRNMASLDYSELKIDNTTITQPQHNKNLLWNILKIITMTLYEHHDVANHRQFECLNKFVQATPPPQKKKKKTKKKKKKKKKNPKKKKPTPKKPCNYQSSALSGHLCGDWHVHYFLKVQLRRKTFLCLYVLLQLSNALLPDCPVHMAAFTMMDSPGLGEINVPSSIDCWVTPGSYSILRQSGFMYSLCT